jgi:hypothetical protein
VFVRGWGWRGGGRTDRFVMLCSKCILSNELCSNWQYLTPPYPLPFCIFKLILKKKCDVTAVEILTDQSEYNLFQDFKIQIRRDKLMIKHFFWDPHDLKC